MKLQSKSSSQFISFQVVTAHCAGHVRQGKVLNLLRSIRPHSSHELFVDRVSLLGFYASYKNLIIASASLNPIRPGLFSRSPGPGGGGRGSEARMPKIKVNIKRLK